MVGKIRLALTPPINHTWNVTLYPTIRGVTTMPMPCGALTLQIDFDFVDHVLVIETSDGGRKNYPPGTNDRGRVLSALHGRTP